MVALKCQNPTLLLMVQVGYRFVFYGEDAETAARVLDILVIEEGASKSFATASVPIFNGYEKYVEKLVDAGLKVGIVEQTETRAEKDVAKASFKDAEKASSKEPFSREVTNVFTPTTFGSPKFLLALKEEDEKGRFDIVGVRATSGEVLNDSFADDQSRSELRRRLQLLEPEEILVVDRISRFSESCLQFYKVGQNNLP